MLNTTDNWIKEYQQKEALWLHDGNQKRPHALLTSGKHSDGFFNSRLVIPDTMLLRSAACDLLVLYIQQGGSISQIKGVVGPQTGATKLAEVLNYHVQIMKNDMGSCFWASPSKHESGGKRSMVFNKEELVLLRHQSVLLCEDVLTTGGSVDLTVTAVRKAGGVVLPFILVLVNRSGLARVNGKKIIALVDRPMPMWAQEECPLCKLGSEAIRPKDNWARLNARY